MLTEQDELSCEPPLAVGEGGDAIDGCISRALLMSWLAMLAIVTVGTIESAGEDPADGAKEVCLSEKEVRFLHKMRDV